MTFNNLFSTKTVAQIQRDAELGPRNRAEPETNPPPLRRTLGALALPAPGIAATTGGGMSAMTANAANVGGPAVIFLFVFTGFACGFSALCYAEFASKI